MSFIERPWRYMVNTRSGRDISRASPARPMGVLFSGGVDSTGILAICLRMGVPCVVGLYKLNSVYP